ncbi:uncharacterized protein LOC120271620 [Dioscorea cayenensis subsp. rotundata]|uniref:Uncharacterized protein LOC120271620 n=1 Tax=Dioscorea cayennensis subsp. rotundata TaxID=55577 RepID=A0AB40C3A6_DIOCR|nr:uncharacterized protein LOC120271620 [Dioscorea cayenensis subsp. rotundata]
MDKSWMCKSRLSQEYLDGVEGFLNFAFNNASEDNMIVCPCIKCANVKWNAREVVLEHLICDGILQGYNCWFFHGECVPSSSSNSAGAFTTSSSSTYLNQAVHSTPNAMGELLRDAFNMHAVVHEDVQGNTSEFTNLHDEGETHDGVSYEQPPIDAAKFYKLLEDMNEKLYDGSKHSRLYFCIRLFHLKCMCGMTGKGLDYLIEFLKEFFPAATIPTNSHESKKVIKDLGLGYEKIHACPNDCMLFCDDRETQQACHVCGSSRWLTTDSNQSFNDDIEVVRKRPAKVLRYFPLIPRLQRIFMSSKTSNDMTWHADGRTNDGRLRHPADAEAWKAFDARFPDFASDPRNVRLGLSSDGFNPFKVLSTSYSTWPVVLIPYNSPPWVGMKQSSFLLSMIIPGDKGPGNDIDIYLQPLIKELKQLWVGVQTYDASVRKNFHLRAALLWTINDFPAYANLSGWSTKGKFACPCCAAQTCSRWLSNGQKFCFMGHRRWLEHHHPYRFQKHLFDGTVELRGAPSSTSGSEILSMLNDAQYSYGKGMKSTLKKSRSDGDSRKRHRQASNVEVDSAMEEVAEESHEAELWKKRSIFFDLPYWEYNLLRHNLDVMHIEKNVSENIIATLLNVEGKSKDNLKSRKDLVDMGIRCELHPEYLPNGRTRLPPASYSMTKKEKDVFCQVLKNIKVPDGYSSNISRCVNQKERKLQSLKSHDHHILLHDLLPIALRSSLTNRVTCAISAFCNIFKILCGKVLTVEELDKLHRDAIISLCDLEKIFPPSFFTIMVHLVIHLPLQAKLGGPVHYRWMYPIEREYKNILRQKMRNRRSNARDIDLQFTKNFHEWLAETVSRGRIVNDEIRILAQGPNKIIKRYKGFIINGFRFHTKSRERLRRTQNSGCIVTSSTMSYASASDGNPLEGKLDYYGVLNDIIELDYFNKYKIVLFRCDWADISTSRGIKKDKFGFTMVNFSRLIHTGENILDEPFVFSSQVKQVFYCKDPSEAGWHVVIQNQPREVFDMGDEVIENSSRTECFPTNNERISTTNDDGQWVREDVDEDVYAY